MKDINEAGAQELDCPLCNGVSSITALCPACGHSLADGGRVENYLGPYSPYDSVVTASISNLRKCVHLLYCSQCGWDERIEIDKINLDD